MATAVREKLYECEVKRRRLKAGGGYERFWKVKTVSDAVGDEDTEFRCKDCHGQLKLNKRMVAGSPGPHVEHKLASDSDYCAASIVFKQATDGRAARLSATPVP
jgi:hypothetical protein